MKKIKLLLVITIITAGLISLPSCQSTKTTAAAKMLKFNFEKGKGYDYEMISNMDQVVEGTTIPIDMTFYYSMDVNDDDGETKTITNTIDRFRMKIGAMGLNIDIDTDKPMASLGETEDGFDPIKAMNTVFNAIKGQQFVIKVDAEGKVLEVKGFENMANRIVDSLPFDEGEKAKMRAEFTSQFSADKTKNQLERVLYIFPNKEVKVGDSWQKKSNMGMGEVPGILNSTYTVTDIEGDMVTLDEKTKIETSGGEAEVEGEIKGTIVVDSRIGLVVNADQEMTIKTKAEGQAVEMKVKTKVKGKAR